jgi:hypothetical protein
MSLSLLILENKWVLEVLYMFLITSICLVIVSKADRFFRLTSHQGIRYFRNAFLFYAVAFVFRYIFGLFADFSLNYSEVVRGMFEYSIIMAGFFLLYSLIWKKFEFSERDNNTSLFNGKIMVFHSIALIVAILDILWGNYYFMFSSQIIAFLFASIISFRNCKNIKSKKFSKFYFIAMLLGLSAWILNFLVATYFHWRHMVLLDIGLINGMFFILILYGVVKITKNGNKKA